MEVWKTIEGFENYQISNLGNVKSLSRIIIKKGKKPYLSKEITIKPQLGSTNYLMVRLYDISGNKSKKIHQLVAIAFLNHKPNGFKLVVNHKNFIRTDNRVENLEIVTMRENGNHKHLKSTSKYTGVHWNKKNKIWYSQIYINGKSKHLGCYALEEDASFAYQKELLNL
jgi:hypothetical protein